MENSRAPAKKPRGAAGASLGTCAVGTGGVPAPGITVTELNAVWFWYGEGPKRPFPGIVGALGLSPKPEPLATQGRGSLCSHGHPFGQPSPGCLLLRASLLSACTMAAINSPGNNGLSVRAQDHLCVPAPRHAGPGGAPDSWGPHPGPSLPAAPGVWPWCWRVPWLQAGWGHPRASCRHPEPPHRVLRGSISPPVKEGLLSPRYEIPAGSWDKQQFRHVGLGAGEESRCRGGWS